MEHTMCAMQSQSTELNELFSALAKAQSEMVVVDRGVSGHYGAFATINDMAKASREALTKYGLSVTFDTFIFDGKKYLKTTLGHSSGQWKSSVMELMLQKQDMQGYGAAVTYAMRYSYKTVVGLIVLDKDEVDSENAPSDAKSAPEQQASPQKPAAAAKPSAEYKKKPLNGFATENQVATITKNLKNNEAYKDYLARLQQRYTLLTNMPKQFASDLIDALFNQMPLPLIEGNQQVGNDMVDDGAFEEVDSDLPF